MSTTVVDAEFRLKLASLKRELESTPGMSKKNAAAAVKAWTDQWKKAEADTVSTMERIKREGGTLGKAAELVGGRTGDALRQIKGLGEIAAGGINATTVALGGAALGVGTVIALGKAFFDVISNVEAYRGQLASLQAQGSISAQDVAEVEMASAAYKGLTSRASELSALISTKLSPTFTDLSIGMVYVSSLAETLSFDAATESARRFYDEISKGAAKAELSSAVPSWMTALPGNKPLSEMASTTNNPAADAAAKAAADAAQRAKAAAAERARVKSEWDASFAAAVKSQSDIEAIFAELDQSISTQMAKAADAAVADIMAEAQAAQDASAIIRKAKLDEVNSTKSANAQMAESEKALTAARMNAAQTFLSNSASVMGTIADIADTMTQRQIDATERGSEAERRALKRQFAVHKAMAIAQATISTAMAVVQALGSLPPPASYVLAAVSGALGAVQIGLIAAEQPQIAHTGGMIRGAKSPDEVPVMAQDGEGMLNRSAVKRVGGPRGVDALNRGEGGLGREVIAVPFYGHRMYDAVTTGALNRKTSSLARALRGVRTTRSGHRALEYA